MSVFNIALLTHVMHNFISYKCLHLNASLLSFRLLFYILALTIYLSQGSLRIPAWLLNVIPLILRCLSEVPKSSDGIFLSSHRPTWWRDSPVSQSLKTECPNYDGMGVLTPSPIHQRCRVLDANLGTLIRGLSPIFSLLMDNDVKCFIQID